MVFQDYALFPHMTVLQNVAFGLKDRRKRHRENRARGMLSMVRLSEMGGRYPYELSGGEQQRVALARSLAAGPRALLLDEPFSNLDPQLRAGLRSEVRSILRSSGVSAIYVTHDQEEALFMGDRVAVLSSGALEQVGSPEEMFHRPRSRFVARFLGAADFLRARSVRGCLETEIGLLESPESLNEGAVVDVGVRPDDVAMGRGGNGLGVVVGRVFRGTHYLYTVALPSGAHVRSLQHHTAHYDDGEVVDVRLEPDQSLMCFLDDDAGETGLTARTMPAP
jgi:iron(III) transport system ATP-binding protein